MPGMGSTSIKEEPQEISPLPVNHQDAEELITADCLDFTVNRSDTIHVKEEPQDHSFPVSPENHTDYDGGAIETTEVHITECFPESAIAEVDSTFIKKEPQEISPANNGNDKELITADFSESMAEMDSTFIKEEPQGTSPSPENHGKTEELITDECSGPAPVGTILASRKVHKDLRGLTSTMPNGQLVQRHVTSSTGETLLKFNFCSVAIAQPKNLGHHVLTDAREGSQKCGIFSATFGESGNLEQHVVIRTGENPFRCKLCSAAFTKSENLKLHMMTHTGEKPYQCILCPAAFSRSGSLKRHMAMHAGVNCAPLRSVKLDILNVTC